jgi:lipopolysaccharide export system ATP-binding protein
MLSVDSVTLDFGSRSILAGCYLECRKGEIVGLLGRNGSGKSSLLKVIFGSLNPQNKHLRIDDIVVKNGLSNLRIVYLPQESFLPPFIGVRELIRSLEPVMQNHLLGIEIIWEVKSRKIDELSGGMKRLIETIWVLGQKADYVLLDEPFSGLAPVHVEFLQELIRETGKQKGIILTDHIYRPLLEISDRVVLLHNNSVYPIKTENDLIQYNYIPDFS